MSVKIKPLPKDFKEPEADQVGLQQWGVKKNLEYEGFKGDAFLFQLLVPEQFCPEGELVLKTKEGQDGTIICFKINIKSYPRYIEYKQEDIVPHYLGLQSNGQHVIEMIAPYRTSDLGDIDNMKDAIKNGNATISFVII